MFRIFAVVVAVFVAALVILPVASLAGGDRIVHLISPNGGEEWSIGSVQTIRWEYDGFFPAQAHYRLWLVGADGGQTNKIYSGEIGGLGLEGPVTSFAWQIPANVTPGKSKIAIEIYLPAENDSNADTYLDADISFAPFSIVSQTTPVPVPATKAVWLNSPELHIRSFYSPVEMGVDASGVYSVDISVFSNEFMPAMWAEVMPSIPPGWLMQYGFDATGVLRIVMAGTQPLKPGKPTENPFLRIFFRTTALKLGDGASFRLSVKLNEDTELYLEETIAFTALRGDVSLDGSITSYDGSLLLRWFVGSISGVDYPGIRESIADVSGNGQITPFDAALIFQYDAGLITVFPRDLKEYAVQGEVAASTTTPTGKPVTSEPARVWLGETVNDGSDYAIPVVVDRMDGVLAGQLEIGPVGDGVIIQPTNLLESYQIVTNQHDGKLFMSFASASSPEGGGEMFWLRFNAKPARLTVRVQINEDPAITLSTAVQATTWGQIKAGFAR